MIHVLARLIIRGSPGTTTTVLAITLSHVSIEQLEAPPPAHGLTGTFPMMLGYAAYADVSTVGDAETLLSTLMSADSCLGLKDLRMSFGPGPG